MLSSPRTRARESNHLGAHPGAPKEVVEPGSTFLRVSHPRKRDIFGEGESARRARDDVRGGRDDDDDAVR